MTNTPNEVTGSSGSNEALGPMEAYCVKCKAKRNMKDAQKVTMKNGRNAAQGKCEVCNTGLYKILAKK